MRGYRSHRSTRDAISRDMQALREKESKDVPRADTVGNKFEKPKGQSDKPAIQGKLRITYLGHRGTGGFVNVYPEQHWHSFDIKLANHDATVEYIARNGFWLPPSHSAVNPNLRKFIPPSAIIEISEVED